MGLGIWLSWKTFATHHSLTPKIHMGKKKQKRQAQQCILSTREVETASQFSSIGEYKIQGETLSQRNKVEND